MLIMDLPPFLVQMNPLSHDAGVSRRRRRHWGIPAWFCPLLDRSWLEAVSEDLGVLLAAAPCFFSMNVLNQTMCRTLQQLADHCYASLFIITLLLPILTS